MILSFGFPPLATIGGFVMLAILSFDSLVNWFRNNAAVKGTPGAALHVLRWCASMGHYAGFCALVPDYPGWAGRPNHLAPLKQSPVNFHAPWSIRSWGVCVFMEAIPCPECHR